MKSTSGNIFKMPQIEKNSGRNGRPKLACLLEKVMAQNVRSGMEITRHTFSRII